MPDMSSWNYSQSQVLHPLKENAKQGNREIPAWACRCAWLITLTSVGRSGSPGERWGGEQSSSPMFYSGWVTLCAWCSRNWSASLLWHSKELTLCFSYKHLPLNTNFLALQPSTSPAGQQTSYAGSLNWNNLIWDGLFVFSFSWLNSM